MRKTKILMVMTALVLVVVGVLVAVTSVLSATQQSVTSSLQVTYTANNVKATVSVASRTQSGSFPADNVLPSATFGPSDSEHSSTIGNKVTLTAGNVTLGFETESEGATFQRYAVYRFSFTNDYDSNHGTPLSVYLNYNAPQSESENNKNVTLLWVGATTSSEPSPIIEGNAWSFTKGNGAFDFTPGASTAVFGTGNGSESSQVPQGSTYYVYLYVLVTDVTLPSSFVLSGTALTFTLVGNETTS